VIISEPVGARIFRRGLTTNPKPNLAVARSTHGGLWTARFSTACLSYRRTKLIAVLPPAHSLSTPLARL